jgi:hypothetical protein
MFGERVRSIRKGGGPAGGGSRWNGGAVVGILIGVVLAIFRLADHSSHPTPRFQQPTFPPQGMDELARLQKQIQDMQFQPPAFPPGGLGGPPDFLQPEEPDALAEDEVPLWEGLCYRIHHESLQPQPTPGRHICALLDPDQLALLRRAAAGERLDADERADLLDALNEVLANHKLYDAAAFRGVPGVASARLLGPRNLNADGNPERAIRKSNRALLESAYPRQIVPVRLKNKLDPQARDVWKDRALRDLEAAKKKYGSRK